MKALLLIGRHAKAKEYSEVEHEYDEIFDDIEEVIMNPPHTWKKYMDKSDGPLDIMNMELEEFNKAMSEKRFHELYKESCHIAAATIYAIHEMKDKKF